MKKHTLITITISLLLSLGGCQSVKPVSKEASPSLFEQSYLEAASKADKTNNNAFDPDENERKQKLIEKWEPLYQLGFELCRDNGLDVAELSQMLENQEKYLHQMTEQQTQNLFDDIGMTLENIFPNIINWYIDLCKVPNVTILGAETARDSAYIRHRNRNGEIVTGSYQFSPRPTANFNKDYLEALSKKVEKENGSDRRHVIVSILVPFITTGIIQSKNFFKAAGVASYLDWTSDCNVGTYKEITLDGSFKNIWSI